jgi:type VI secretion system protein ImpL
LLVYLLAVAVLLLAALIAVGGVLLLHLHGTALVFFVVLILLIGFAAAGVILYLHFRSKKDEKQDGDPSGGNESGEIDLLLNDANRKLRESKRQGAKSVNELAMLYLLGDAGAAKTTLVVRSGLEPELLAGTAPRAGEADVVPTPLLNLWFTPQAAILESGLGVRQSDASLEQVVRRTRPRAYRSAFGSGAPPRLAVVCVAAKLFLGGDVGPALASARSTGKQLREISRLLGAALPVYVIITKLDEVPGFAEYVRNLSSEEGGRILGTTLEPMQASAGVYADNASRELTSALDAITYALGEFRVEILSRETEPRNAAKDYEFPREFGKLRGNLSQYLVELCKPTHLSANPYLRGFYFCGVRAQIVQQQATPQAARVIKQTQPEGATQYLSLAGGKLQPAYQPSPLTSSTRVPHWTFLARIFPEAILGDRTALSASRQTAPARVFRRVLFATLGSLCGLYTVFLLISFFNNLALEHRLVDAAHALPVAIAAATVPPSLSELQSLDQLRQVIVQLDGFARDGAPWTYRFGLYQGDKLARRARMAYFDRFRPILLNPTQANFVSFLHALPETPGGVAGDDGTTYDAAYRPLKAYLITTSNPERSTAAFLSPVFFQYFAGSRQLDPEQQRLVRLQADFYSGELARQNPYSIVPDAGVVRHARGYLANFHGAARIYLNMLTAADNAHASINFNQKYPGSAESVVDPVIVRGAFTRAGFAGMQDAIQNPDRYAHGETWVLGEQGTITLDKSALGNQLATQYSTDYIKAWQGFLNAGRVVGCGGASPGGLKPTSALLDRLARPDSALLEFFQLISHNTAVADPNIRKTFKSAQALTDPEAVDVFIGPGNKSYMDAMGQLSVAVDLLAKNPPASPDPAAFSSMSSSVQAGLNAVTQTQQAFSVDPVFQTEKKVTALLRAPIECAEKLVPAAGAVVNGAGGQLCKVMGPVLAKQPFSPGAGAQASLAEVDAIFAPDTGAIWTAYNSVLKPVLIPSGSRYVPNPAGGATPAFAAYFTRAAQISAALYPAGAKTPSFSFVLKTIPSKEIEGASLVMDGQRIAAGASSQQFNWVGATANQASLAYNHGEALKSQGTWALFQLVHHARVTPSSGDLRLEFPIEVSGQPTTASDGTPMVVRFDLSGTGAELLGPNGLAGFRCVPGVLK